MTTWKPIEETDFDKPIWVIKYDLYHKDGQFVDAYTPGATKFTDCHGWYDNEPDAIRALRHLTGSTLRLEKVYYRKLKEGLMPDELTAFVDECEALTLWKKRFKPGFSTDVADNLTCGYGKLDDYGNWQYPLYPAEDYLAQTKINFPRK